MKKTMTLRDFLEAVLSGENLDYAINGVTLREKAQALIDDINKKNEARKNAEKKPSKSYIENEPTRKAIYDYLVAQNGESDIAKNIALAVGITTPKANAAIRQMVEIDHSVERIDKGRNKPLEYRVKQ